MGGSAIGGDLVAAAVPEPAGAGGRVRGYELPAWAARDTLIVAVSYSGETDETLACVAQAPSSMAAVRSAWPAAARCRASPPLTVCPLVRVPGGVQPRAAARLPLRAAARGAARRPAWWPRSATQVDEAAACWQRGDALLDPEVRTPSIAAKAWRAASTGGSP